jgi:hypothetical protein
MMRGKLLKGNSMPTDNEDKLIGEDLSTPVNIEPGSDAAVPDSWTWSKTDASASTKAEFHINHSDVSRVLFGSLDESDMFPDSQFKIIKDIPVIIIDSLDSFWAGESKTKFPLTGLRVPVSGETISEAKQKLAADLAAQFRLLLILNSTMPGKLAEGLKQNLVLYNSVMQQR